MQAKRFELQIGLFELVVCVLVVDVALRRLFAQVYDLCRDLSGRGQLIRCDNGLVLFAKVNIQVNDVLGFV
jgi:hypothetical protein